YRFRIAEDTERALQLLEQCIEEANPLPERRHAQLRFDIRDLWKALTRERASRKADYLGDPSFFSAYVRYFMPWNLVRLSALLTDLELRLPDGATIMDIGSGPLTFLIALYCAKPELRTKSLTFLCIDRAPRIMETGMRIFELLAARHGKEIPPWNIILRKQRYGEPIKEKADLVCAINVLNEFFWNHEGTLWENAVETYGQLCRSCVPNGSVLIVEPGEPRSGALVSALRAAAILKGDTPVAPCTHNRACPMPGIFKSGQEFLIRESQRKLRIGKNQTEKESSLSLLPVRMPSPRAKYPWCHFSLSIDFAPRWLRTLSASAGLAKEKLSFSFLLVSRTTDRNINDIHAATASLYRIVSELIQLPGRNAGRYSCNDHGYVLIARKGTEDIPPSGALVFLSREDTTHEARGKSYKRDGGSNKPVFDIEKKNVHKARPSGEEAKYKNQQMHTETVTSVPIDEKSGALLIYY
ncbi:MAG: hypothetical protein N3A02_07755, partial [Rectinema sp.]|nr:hypothetical protein [Rectinema sp.]